MENIKKWLKENCFKTKRNIIIACCALALTVILTVLTGVAFAKFSKYEVYFYGKEEGNTNVTSVEKLSKYCPNIEGTAGDADVYVMVGKDNQGATEEERRQDGPSILILGGTHPNEPSGQLTATILLENLQVNYGTVYIITETNRSAFTHSYPQEASPFYYTLTTADGGTRTFKFGSRATNTNEQWPNPDVYVHEYSGQKLSTNETRNLNRAYPGVENGTYTEKVAYAIRNLIVENDICITVDLHEASPEYLTINAIVAHQRARAGIVDARIDDMNDQMYEYHRDVLGQDKKEASRTDIHSEESPLYLHGLTHRELGDYTNTLSVLCETSNAAQGKYRGAFQEALITYGEEEPDYEGDRFYEKSVMLDDGNLSTKDGILYAKPVSITERVARHTESIYKMIEAYNQNYADETLYDNRAVETAVSLKTEAEVKACAEKRASQGEFDINWGNLYDSSECDSIYASIYNHRIGYYLHNPE